MSKGFYFYWSAQIAIGVVLASDNIGLLIGPLTVGFDW